MLISAAKSHQAISEALSLRKGRCSHGLPKEEAPGLHPVQLTRTQANPTCLSNSIGLRYPIVECRRSEL